MKVRKITSAALLCGAVAMTTTACLQNPQAGGGSGAAGQDSTVDGGTADNDKTVTILGAFGGTEEKQFNASLAEFTRQTGIKVQYTGDQDFTTTVKSKVNSGDSPDIAMFPQPGGLLEMAAQHKVQPIDTYLDYDALDKSLVPGMMDAARYKGRVYGAPMRLAVKSIVWYPKSAAATFAKAPQSIQELEKLSADLKAKGTAPWCDAWMSDQSTGWVGTDWLEQYMLDMYGPDVYDQWTKHQIPFNDPKVVKALDEVGKILKTDGYVYGGAKLELSTKFSDAFTPAFATPPKCTMLRQGNFATGFFPANVQKNLDATVGTFTFPSYQGGFAGNPVLGGGDIAALFNGNDPDAQKVMQFLTSAKFGAPWAKAGGWLSPHKTFDTSNYPDQTTKDIAKMATSASVFRFDGSDVMPKVVGSGTFWTEMVKWLSGQDSTTTLTNIDKSWPAS